MTARRKGYTKRKKGVETTKFFTDVPVSLVSKLDYIAAIENKSKSQALEDLIREAYAVEYNVTSSWDVIGAENKDEKTFVELYIRKHFGENPDDPELAQSKALEAYWEEKGFNFGSDEDTFKLPEGLQ